MVAFSSFPFFANFGPSWLTPPPSELDVFIFRPDSMHCLARAGFQTLRSILGFRCWVTPCKALYRRRCTQTGILAPPFFLIFPRTLHRSALLIWTRYCSGSSGKYFIPGCCPVFSRLLKPCPVYSTGLNEVSGFYRRDRQKSYPFALSSWWYTWPELRWRKFIKFTSGITMLQIMISTIKNTFAKYILDRLIFY